MPKKEKEKSPSGISKYAVKRQVKILREQFCTVMDCPESDLHQAFKGHLMSHPPIPKTPHEARVLELQWLRKRLESIRVERAPTGRQGMEAGYDNRSQTQHSP